MPINKLVYDSPYDAIPRAVPQGDCSVEALGVWVYLISKAGDWMPREDDIRRRFNFGRDRYFKVMRELRELGLLTHEVLRAEDGTISGHVMTVHAVPATSQDVHIRPNQTPENPESGESAHIKNKERTKNREGRRFTPPTLLEVTQYVREKSLSIDPGQFFAYFEAGNWHDSRGNPVKNWKQKALTWHGKNGRAPSPASSAFTKTGDYYY